MKVHMRWTLVNGNNMDRIQLLRVVTISISLRKKAVVHNIHETSRYLYIAFGTKVEFYPYKSLVYMETKNQKKLYKFSILIHWAFVLCTISYTVVILKWLFS